LDGDQNSLVAQEGKWGKIFFPQNDSIGPTPFGHHLIVGVCWTVTRIFRLPKKVEVNLISFLKRNSSPPCLLGRRKNFSHHLMVGVCWMVIEKIWSPSNTPPLSNGDRIF
jgi:hypothetical protein